MRFVALDSGLRRNDGALNVVLNYSEEKQNDRTQLDAVQSHRNWQ